MTPSFRLRLEIARLEGVNVTLRYPDGSWGNQGVHDALDGLRAVVRDLDAVQPIQATATISEIAPKPGAVILSAAELAEIRAHVEAARDPNEAPARLDAVKRLLSS